MSARSSWDQQNSGGHRPPLQCILLVMNPVSISRANFHRNDGESHRNDDGLARSGPRLRPEIDCPERGFSFDIYTFPQPVQRAADSNVMVADVRSTERSTFEEVRYEEFDPIVTHFCFLLSSSEFVFDCNCGISVDESAKRPAHGKSGSTNQRSAQGARRAGSTRTGDASVLQRLRLA